MVCGCILLWLNLVYGDWEYNQDWLEVWIIFLQIFPIPKVSLVNEISWHIQNSLWFPKRPTAHPHSRTRSLHKEKLPRVFYQGIEWDGSWNQRHLICINTVISCFLKVCIIPLCFYRRLTLVPVFSNPKKFEEDFQFYEKWWKIKVAFSIDFIVSLPGGSAHPGQQEGPHRAPSQDPHTASRRPPTRALNCVCAHLCFISIDSMHLLAGCVLRY